MGNITIFDYVLLPLYLLVIYLIAYSFRNTKYPEGHPWRPYFIPGLTLKIIGAVVIGMVYEYHYKGGDTFWMYFHSKLINASIDDSFSTWFRLITQSADMDNLTDAYHVSKMFWYTDNSTYMVARFGALLGILCFTKYLPIVVMLAAIAFSGAWAMFRAFAEQYPKQVKPIAIAILFLPGTIMWGSGLFKDTLCMFGIGWIVYFFYRTLEQGKFEFRATLMFALSIAIIAVIKVYILLSFLPLLVIKTVMVRTRRINSKLLRQVVFWMVIVVFAYTAVFISKYAQKAIVKYSIENIAGTAKSTGAYLLSQSEQFDGSGYSLGNFDPTVSGMVKKALPAINVTLFRPYIWESGKPIVLLASLESMVILLFTLAVLFKVKPIRILRRTAADPNILFCLLFALIFAFFVGISSYNFGTLSRYKIPCMPFYLIFLILVSGVTLEADKPLIPDPKEELVIKNDEPAVEEE